MSVNLGWVKLPRNLKEQFFYSKSEAVHLYVHLLLSANHKDADFIHGLQKVTIKRGQLLTGRIQLSQQLGIQELKIKRLLDMLESEQLIEQQKTNKYTIISVLAYDCSFENEQQSEQQMNNKRTTNEQQMNTNNNDKNEKNEKNTLKERKLYSEDFEKFWISYDRGTESKGSKSNAQKEWNRLNKEDKLNAFSLLSKYYLTQKEPKYRPHAERYIKARLWEGLDYVSEIKPIIQTSSIIKSSGFEKADSSLRDMVLKQQQEILI